jgi:hypothetical protein
MPAFFLISGLRALFDRPCPQADEQAQGSDGQGNAGAELEQAFGVADKHRAHRVDGQQHHGQADEVGFQFFDAVDLAPAREPDLLDEELVEADRCDMQDRARQEDVHVLYHLNYDSTSVHLGGCLCETAQCGDQQMEQQFDETEAAKNQRRRRRRSPNLGWARQSDTWYLSARASRFFSVAQACVCVC